MNGSEHRTRSPGCSPFASASTSVLSSSSSSPSASLWTRRLDSKRRALSTCAPVEDLRMASKEDSYRAKEHPKFENPRNALGAGTLAHQRSSPRGFMESRANGGNKGRVRRDFAYFSFSRHAIGLFGASAGGGAAAWFGGSGSARAYPLWPVRTRGRRPNSVIDPSDKRQRIMILMSDTGGGHRASAEALKAGFRSVFGDKHRIDIVDLWTDHTPWPFHEFPKSYSFMVHHPWIWRFNFTMTQPQFVHIPLATFGTLLMGSRISAAFDKYKPNLIVSVHPLMQHVPVRVLRQRIAAGIQDPSTAFATVVTDLTTCHNTWFHPGVDRCYVATEATRRQALGLGLHPDQIRLYGLPIRPAFGKRSARKGALRRKLGMNLKTPAILLVGGGEGMGPVERTVDALCSVIGADCQVVVVCGRNAKLVEKLSSKEYPEGMRVHVKGFVTNMPDLMNACDVIITKAGPGTISEALICGLPLVLNAFVPCQEEGNIPFVTENEVGIFETDPMQAANAIKGWLASGQGALKKMAARARALGRPDALFDIVRDLETLIGRKVVVTKERTGFLKSLVFQGGDHGPPAELATV